MSVPRAVSRALPTLVLLATLSGCGFHLQGRVPLSRVLTVTYVDAPDVQTDFVQDLRRALLVSGASLGLNSEEATAVIHIERDALVERVLSVSARNIPREYELTYTVRFSVRGRSGELLPAESVSASREFSFDERALLAKDREQEVLREALARDLVGLVMRRLSSLP